MKPAHTKRYLFAIGLLLLLYVLMPPSYVGDCILIGASAKGNVGLAKIMLDLGADPNTKTSDPGYALVQAAYYDRTKVVKLLLQHGTDPNSHVSGGETALMYASLHASPATVKALLDGGADPLLGDGNSQTPYTYAEGRPEILALLRQAKPVKHREQRVVSGSGFDTDDAIAMQAEIRHK